MLLGFSQGFQLCYMGPMESRNLISAYEHNDAIGVVAKEDWLLINYTSLLLKIKSVNFYRH